MALKTKGDLSFKLQVGARGPYENPYGLLSREEEWIGEQDDLASFLASKPLGSSWSGDSLLKLTDYQPHYLEAGMVRVALTYAGGTVIDGKIFGRGRTTPAISINESAGSMQANGTVKWKFGNSKTGSFDAQMTIRYRAKSITYHYTTTARPTGPAFSSLAESDLAATINVLSVQTSDPVATLLNQNAKILFREAVYNADTDQTVNYYVWPDGTFSDPRIPVAYLTTRKETVMYGTFDGYTLASGTSLQRVGSINANEVGVPVAGAQFFEVAETWELEGLTNVV